MKNVYGIVLLYLLGAGLSASGQQVDLWQKAKQNPNLGRHKYIAVKFHSGSHLYNGEELKQFLQKGYTSVEVRMGWQSTGKKVWQRVYNYPSYGIGMYSGNIGDPSILGNPSGIYGFFDFPFLRRRRHHFNAEMALGFTYDLNGYDPKNNPLNDAISSKVDVYFNVSVGGVFKASELFDLIYGIDMTHFSNGRTHTPNLGLNMYGLNVGVRYHYNAIRRIVKQQIDSTYEPLRRPVFVTTLIPPVKRVSNVDIYGAFGVVQNESSKSSGSFYGTVSLVLDYARRYSHMGSFTAGLDGFYDASLGGIYSMEGKQAHTSDKMLGGVHVGHLLHIQRFDLVTQVGTYWFRRDNYKGNVFMRIGLRYNTPTKTFVQIGLKTLNGAAADWIEWGIGYRI
ncbi:acyloxyacyl hydrolase [Chitinophaga pendula]|uniref:acyloxyacyl hydrolase n=1 Tax=Chitinophaga TaxID=79328 RepID=UPI000BAFDFB1|nr:MULTISPECIES: acyloxyacyl hydrolase [Chitinophaga]ASZ11543.1 hypothetical protein CK934_11540 [Chitinophaga sp. MD30]UCJ05446.1 acyloxyacyl hydrolase [Chitinophaga pendula]